MYADMQKVRLKNVCSNSLKPGYFTWVERYTHNFVVIYPVWGEDLTGFRIPNTLI